MYPDYVYYSTSRLYFDGATRSRTITLYIRNDMVVENQFEFFSVYMRNYDSAVVLNGSTARVTIEDDDGELSLQVCKQFACEVV